MSANNTSRKVTDDKSDNTYVPVNLTSEFKKCYYAVKFNKGFVKDSLTTPLQTNANYKDDEIKINDDNQKTENNKNNLKNPYIMDLDWYLKNLNIPTDYSFNNQSKKFNTIKTSTKKPKKNIKKKKRNNSNKKLN